MAERASADGLAAMPPRTAGLEGNLRMLHVEDDAFQRMALEMIVSFIQQETPGLTIQLTQASQASEALEALESASKDGFDLVLLDYLLPDRDGDKLLPTLREQLGPTAAIVMLSGDAQEALLQRCWLDLGADTYRVKPVSRPIVEELCALVFEKRVLLQKRRRDQMDEEGSPTAKRPTATAVRHVTLAGEEEPEMHMDMEQALPAIVDLLSIGRMGPVHLALVNSVRRPDMLSERELGASAPSGAVVGADGTPTQTARAMKVYPLQCVRGAPPPPHPHVNKVLMRVVKGGQCIELRDLCEGGELFDLLLELNLEDASDGEPATMLPSEEILCWISQIAGAVAHCHSHGAIHGQLHPENLLLLGDDSTCVITGFTGCEPGAANGSGKAAADISRGGGQAPKVSECSVPAIDLSTGSSSSSSTTSASTSLGASTSASSDALAPKGEAPKCDAPKCDAPKSDAPKGDAPLSAALNVTLRPFHESLDAPELKGRTTATPRELAASDVHSVGLLLTYMLTGRPEVEELQVLAAKLDDNLPAAVTNLGIHSLGESSGPADTFASPELGSATGAASSAALTNHLVQLALQMVNRDPNLRPASMEVLRRLDRYRQQFCQP